jgi:hypothetical protein
MGETVNTILVWIPQWTRPFQRYGALNGPYKYTMLQRRFIWPMIGINSCKGSVKCIPPFGIRQRFGKHVPAATNTRNNRRIVGRIIFYAAHVLSKKNLWVCLCNPLPLLGNNSVKTFPPQRKIVGGVVFYAVRVVSKESREISSSQNLVFIFKYRGDWNTSMRRFIYMTKKCVRSTSLNANKLSFLTSSKRVRFVLAAVCEK